MRRGSPMSFEQPFRREERNNMSGQTQRLAVFWRLEKEAEKMVVVVEQKRHELWQYHN
jgi:hypothetical protein